MLINVNVEVPDDDSRCQECLYADKDEGKWKFYCLLFNVPLKTNHNQGIMKCPECLNATRVEAEE